MSSATIIPASVHATLALAPATLALAPATLVKYTVDDFERIKNNGFSYTLSPETMAIIQALAEQVGAPEYIKTPQFTRVDVKEGTGTGTGSGSGSGTGSGTGAGSGSGSGSGAGSGYQYNKKRRGPKTQEVNDEDWDAVRNFKNTLLVKKEGVGAVIDQIRKHLNKMTSKTYDNLRDCIIKDIEGLIDGILEKNANITTIADEEFVAEMNKIGEALFTIASGNSFYSTMYATLYKELMAKFAFMQTIFENNFQKFNTLFNDFAYCDPNKDYDKFCQNNKVNEKRRALSLFYVNLMKENLIDTSEIVKIVTLLQTNMRVAILDATNKNIVDEMTEIFYIIIVNGFEKIKDVEEWSSLEEFINQCATFKTTSYPGITNKAIFKFMDILDTF